MQNDPILVIGATGKTGRRVATQLEALGHNVRRGSRNSATPFDWEAPETWAPALNGASSAYVTYFPDLAFPGAVEKLDSLVETAKSSGVKKIVLLSGRGEHHARLGEEVEGVDAPPYQGGECQYFFKVYVATRKRKNGVGVECVHQRTQGRC